MADAVSVSSVTGDRLVEAKIHLLKGDVLLRLPYSDSPGAEVCFRNAIEIARHQRAKTWELRAAIRLAGLWGEHRRRAEASDLLAPVYKWFTEGFDTPDLKEAKTLLNELA